MSHNQFSPSSEGAESPRVALFRVMIRTMPPRAFLSQALIVVDRYNIADKLNDGPRSSDELAQMSQTSAHALYWLLHRLAHVGIFEEVSPHHFANTELSRALRSALADSLPERAVISEHDESLQTWWKDFETQLQGRPTLEDFLGEGLWTDQRILYEKPGLS